MARVELKDIVLQPDVITRLVRTGEGTVQVNTHNGGPALVYPVEEGGVGSLAALTLDNGRVEGWVEEGSYDLVVTPDHGDPYTDRVHAVDADNVFHPDADGNVSMGSNPLVDPAQANTSWAKATFFLSAEHRRVFLNIGRQAEIGDPPDIAYGRAPGTYPDGPVGWTATLNGSVVMPAAGTLFAMTANEALTPNKFDASGVLFVGGKTIFYARLTSTQFLDCWSADTGTLADDALVEQRGLGKTASIGVQYWTPWNSSGGGYDTRAAGTFVRTAEPTMSAKSGGKYFIFTSAVGTDSRSDRVVVNQTGFVGILSSQLADDSVAARLHVGGGIHAVGTVTGGRSFGAQRGYLAAASGLVLPAATINVRITGILPAAGSVLIDGTQTITYTGQVDDGSRTVQLTGCSGGSGTMPNFATVVGLPAATDTARGAEMGAVGPSSQLGLKMVDVILYRDAADRAKIDDSLHVGAEFRHLGSTLGFYGAAGASKPTGVPVTAAGIHAALVTLGAIAA